ncbi:MAG: hypothetical protein IPM56_07400 [Ignavibacteriales bacterium]|nr:MAG: hypothetical protein IPM56_07400 [Ignavibacteriales bacterium]
MLKSPFVIAQLTANAISIIGLLFFGWNIGDILLIFWVEAVIICFFTLLMMGVVERWKFIFKGPFVVFIFAYVLLVLLAFVEGVSTEITKELTGTYPKRDYLEMTIGLLPAIASFLISHGIAFVLDFMGKQHYKSIDSSDIAARFLRELIPLGSAAITSVFIIAVFGNYVYLFVIALLVKIAFDMLVQLEDKLRRGRG